MSRYLAHAGPIGQLDATVAFGRRSVGARPAPFNVEFGSIVRPANRWFEGPHLTFAPIGTIKADDAPELLLPASCFPLIILRSLPIDYFLRLNSGLIYKNQPSSRSSSTHQPLASYKPFPDIPGFSQPSPTWDKLIVWQLKLRLRRHRRPSDQWYAHRYYPEPPVLTHEADM